MTDAAYRKMASEVAPSFASVPGLLGKIWIADGADLSVRRGFGVDCVFFSKTSRISIASSAT